MLQKMPLFGALGEPEENMTMSYGVDTVPPKTFTECLYGGCQGGCRMPIKCPLRKITGLCRLPAQIESEISC